jgi:hypothetical protein
VKVWVEAGSFFDMIITLDKLLRHTDATLLLKTRFQAGTKWLSLLSAKALYSENVIGCMWSVL